MIKIVTKEIKNYSTKSQVIKTQLIAVKEKYLKTAPGGAIKNLKSKPSKKSTSKF